MKRIEYLESIRGIGSFQVLLLHCFTAFAPGLTNFNLNRPYLDMVHQSPIFLIYDGYSSVYIFFILSGMVLSFSFGIENPKLLYILPRIVRLLIPAVAAVILGFMLKIAFGSPNTEAGVLINSDWLKSLWLPPSGFGFVLKDGFVNALWLGYDDASTWSWLKSGVPVDPFSSAYSAPLWTLSIEIQGSLLVLLLSMTYAASRKIWAFIVVLMIIILFKTHFLCFIAGHIAFIGSIKYREFRLKTTLSIIFIVIGAILCLSAETGRAYIINSFCDYEIYFALPCSHLEQKVIGSMFIFLGATSSREIRRLLEYRALIGLGRISLSLYLVHWPIIFGFGSSIFLGLSHLIPVDIAGAITIGIVIPTSLIAAHYFRKIDLVSISLSRLLRRAIDRVPRANLAP